MSTSFESSLPSDIRLLLRADAEQSWLHREVIPVLHDVETHVELADEEARAEEEVGAALSYLEAMWSEAAQRARETDAAHNHLRSCDERSEALAGPAGRYHAAVRILREILAKRVRPFVEPALDFEGALEGTSSKASETLRVTDKRPDGCPRAA
jgi:DNA repair ATPase RecN